MSGDDQDTQETAGTTPADGTDTPTGTGGTDTTGTDTSSPSGDTGGTDTSTPSGDTGGTDTSTPSGDTGGTDTSTPAGDTGGTDTSTPSGDTGGTDTSTPSGDTGGTDTSTPSGDTGGSDTSTPSGDTGGTDTSTPSGDTGGSGDSNSGSGDTGSGDGGSGSGDNVADNNSSGGTGSGNSGSGSGNGGSTSGGTGSGSSRNSAGSASPDPNDPSPSGGWFKDGPALADSLNDSKKGDLVVASKAADAQAILDKFMQSTGTNPWKGLDRQVVGNRLKAIVADSRVIKQGSLNLCGPAAFLVCWAKRDPVAFANYATTLFNTGKSAIGKMAVTPAPGMLSQDYSAISSTTGTVQADWMIMGALKESNQLFWQGKWNGDPKQDIAGMTLPSQIVDWFNAAGIYSSVKNEANLATSAGIPQASNILNANGQDVVLLIHLNLMTGVLSSTDSDGWLLRQFPNHWIVLLNEVTQEATPTGPGKVDLSFWTWGDTHLAMDNSTDPAKHLIQIPQDQFIKYYFGSITATMKNAGS